MISLKTILIVAGIIYYLYSGLKDKDAQKKKKTPSNPTPSQKSTIDDLLEKMLEQQNKTLNQPSAPEPNPVSQSPKKLFKPKEKKVLKQGLPFEKRKFSEPREMPSRKQIERVTLREKKATEQPVIKVKDYDDNILDHDLPHPKHFPASQSNIKFSFKEKESEHFDFDLRQAIISQIILERKEF